MYVSRVSRGLGRIALDVFLRFASHGKPDLFHGGLRADDSGRALQRRKRRPTRRSVGRSEAGQPLSLVTQHAGPTPSRYFRQRSVGLALLVVVFALVAPGRASAEDRREVFSGLSAAVWSYFYDGGCVYEEHFTWVQRGNEGRGWVVKSYEGTYDACTGVGSTSYGEAAPTSVTYQSPFESLKVAASVPMDDGSINEIVLRLTGVGEVQSGQGVVSRFNVPSELVFVEVGGGRLRYAAIEATVDGRAPYDAFGFISRIHEVLLVLEPATHPPAVVP